MTTLVTGATGTLGHVVVRQLRDAGRPARVFSRRPRPDGDPDWATGDLETGAGLVSAVEGVGTVIHCASDGRRPGADLGGVHQLLAALRDRDTHLVYVSIVGVDRVPLRYYREKLAVEQVIERSDLPWTILRATQFHDLIHLTARQLSKLPVMPIFAGVRFQPVDARDVAERLVELALDRPVGLAPDIGGPQVYGMKELMRSYLTAKGRHRLTLPIRTPGGASKAYRAGANLTLNGATIGARTWEDFLAEQTTR